MLRESIRNKSLSDIVILAAKRTPLGKAVKGSLSQMYPEELLQQVVEGTIKASGIEKKEVDDILVGTVLQKLGGQKASAMAIKSLDFPVTTTVNTINRQCALSAQALSYVANSIRAGDLKVGIAAGVESMTHDYFPHRGIPERISSNLFDSACQEAKDVLMPMGITSENVAKKFGITRGDQDAFAALSHKKAAAATEAGHFSREIIPVKARTPTNEEKTEFKEEIITKDQGIRASSTVEKLSTLKPVFAEDGTTTAGNSSQITDGASAVVLTTREYANQLGVKPIGRYIGASVAGVEGRYMGIGPSAAVPMLLQRLGLETKDIDLWELNEAFASQSLYVLNKLNLGLDNVNIFGGAIALGHPLGATGARCISTLLNGLGTTDGELGVVSMCTSTGQGYAGLFVRE